MIYLNNVSYTRSATKTLKKLDRKTKQRIKKEVERLKFVPPVGDIKALKGLSWSFALSCWGFENYFPAKCTG